MTGTKRYLLPIPGFLVMMFSLLSSVGESQEKDPPQQEQAAEEESLSAQDLLDKAFELKLAARSGQEFAKVVQLCDQALKKGLDKENGKFAEQLLTSTIYQYVSGVCKPILGDRPDPSWRQRRAVALPLLTKLLAVDNSHGDALVLTARLQILPGGDTRQATQLLDKAVVVFKEDDKKLSEALFLRASLEQDPARKLVHLDRAIKLDVANTDAWQARALLQLRKGNFEQAARDLETLLEKEDDNYLAILALAEAMANLKKPDKALELAGRAIKLKPEVPQAYELRARIHVLNNKMKQALADVNKSIHLQPGSVSSLLLRARLLQAQEKLDDALKDVKTVLKIRPGMTSALFLKSTIHEGQREFGKAADSMQEIVKQDPENEQAQLMLGMYYSMAFKVKEALDQFDQILEKNDNNTAAFYWRADTRLNVGDHKGARQDYENVLERNPQHEATLNNLAWLLATSPENDLRDGKRAVKLALQAGELSKHKKPHILSTLAAAYAESGDYTKAVEWSTRAVKMGREDLQGQLEAELKSYQKKKPWREKKELLEEKRSEAPK
jgi:tetratricopeptide (TPR) repeat protein